jgi:hypothetical protein
MTGLTNALGFLAEKHATARSGSLAYIRPHPGSFESAGVRVKHPYSKEVLQTISKSSLIKSIGFSIYFVSDSAKLALVRVRGKV